MIRMLVVDDETATRNGLVRHIDWKTLGVDMVQAVESAQEALDLCEGFQPDLVLSDIRMRGMDGVEMCTILHRRFPECRIIFISGYSDKEYLKAAIHLGAVDYVEKPVDTEQLKRAVRKAMASILTFKRKGAPQIAQGKAYLRREAFFSLLREPLPGELPTQQMEKSGLFREGYPLMRICILRLSVPAVNLVRFGKALDTAWKLSQISMEDYTIYEEFWDNRRLILLLCGYEETIGNESPLCRALSQVCEKPLDGIALFLALGPSVDAPEKLCLSYQTAHEVEKTVFFRGYGKAAAQPRQELPYVLKEDFTGEFRRALSTGNEAEAGRVLNRLFDCLRESEATASAFVQGLYFSLEREINEEYLRLFPERQEKMTEKWESDSRRLETLDTLEGYTGFLREQMREMFGRNNKDECNNSVVARVVRMIQQEYGRKDLSVKQIAESVYLTPTYLSGLFKRKTGQTIGEYITSVRMERAKELLREPQLKLYHVSEQVGYEDSNYFAKIFKKQTGSTPSEYRERNRL